MKKGPHPLRNIAAFTLIELLVCVGIVVILALLATVGAKKAISTSQASRCMNNMRQIGAAANMYMGENNNLIPTGSNGDSVGWQSRIAPYLGLNPAKDTEAKVLRCPASPSRQPRSYRWNQTRDTPYSSTSKTLVQAYPVRFLRVARPSLTAMLFDISYTGTAQFDLWQNNNNFWGDTYDLSGVTSYDKVSDYPRPHYDNKAVNILYYDGHVAVGTYPLPTVAYYLDYQGP